MGYNLDRGQDQGWCQFADEAQCQFVGQGERLGHPPDHLLYYVLIHELIHLVNRMTSQLETPTLLPLHHQRIII